ncbi:MAG TPA: SdrD B-like domain-containing protein [Amnibacterium sp.]|uniref:SdrD B-like domain-containing protein n=1 Tax=Amnibacterium sp. TaxID=1872496 RepID=UPI002F955ACA
MTGTVYYDKNQNGRQDPGEPGLAGIPVYLSSSADSETPATEKSASTCTDSQGHYTLTPRHKYAFRVLFRTGWFRTQCPGLTCPSGGPGDNVRAGPEWIYSPPVTGKAAHQFDVGLIPDAGQHVITIHSTRYTGYPPDLTKAHPVDLTARFTDDEAQGCNTTANGVSCHIGQTVAQTLYIANSGLTSVSGIKGVMQLPWGEEHKTLRILRSGSSPQVTGLSDVKVTPAKGPRPPGQAATADNYTTITFTILGTVPPAGIVAVLSTDLLAHGTPGTQIVGHAGITAEQNGSLDTDSAFCTAPALPQQCQHISNTHSFLDLTGDDNDSDRFNVLS